MEDLTAKVCRACEGMEDVLPLDKITEYSKQVPEWTVDETKSISREFEFPNFKEALEFVNKVGNLAEKEGHHPDINLHDYKKVKITLTTHAISGLSENDFIEAAKIDIIYKHL